MSDDPITAVRNLARSHGLEFRDCGEGHVQIRGNGVTVNYWPLSRRQKVYCPDTGARLSNCTPYNAVAVAMRGKSGDQSRDDIRPRAHRSPRKVGPDPSDAAPRTSNPSGVRHFYDGDASAPPPWSEDLGPGFISAQSDRLRILAKRCEDRAIRLRAKADEMDRGET